MPKSDPPKPLTIVPSKPEDQSFLACCHGGVATTWTLPSGDQVATVDGKRWRCVVQKAVDESPLASLVLEDRKP